MPSLKLKLQYFGHLMQKADSFEKTLMLGEGKGKELEKVKEGESIPSELDKIIYYCNKAFLKKILQITNNYLLSRGSKWKK